MEPEGHNFFVYAIVGLLYAVIGTFLYLGKRGKLGKHGPIALKVFLLLAAIGVIVKAVVVFYRYQ